MAILLDGEFVKKVLGRRLKHFPSHADVMAEVARIQNAPSLAGLTLYRIFYYTADPATGTAVHPLDGSVINFGQHPAYARNVRLIDRIENEPDVAVRRGTLAHQGWELGRSALRQLTAGTKKSIVAQDVVPKIQQKGVDMRIGLDIATLALKRLVSTVVIVTGDSDLVPAMKLARREGVRVILDTLHKGKGVRPELKVHADRVI